jgi:hypothetical protein
MGCLRTELRGKAELLQRREKRFHIRKFDEKQHAGGLRTTFSPAI